MAQTPWTLVVNKAPFRQVVVPNWSGVCSFGTGGVQYVCLSMSWMPGVCYASLLGANVQSFMDVMYPTVMGCSSRMMHRAFRPKMSGTGRRSILESSNECGLHVHLT